jgi:hypothetical protein
VGAVGNTLLSEVATLLYIDRFLAVAVTGDVDRNNSSGMAIPSLELSPGPAAQVAIVHPRIRDASRQLAHSELKRAAILLQGKGFVGIESGDGAKVIFRPETSREGAQSVACEPN